VTLDEYWRFIKGNGSAGSGLQYLRSRKRKSKSSRQPKPKPVGSRPAAPACHPWQPAAARRVRSFAVCWQAAAAAPAWTTRALRKTAAAAAFYGSRQQPLAPPHATAVAVPRTVQLAGRERAPGPARPVQSRGPLKPSKSTKVPELVQGAGAATQRRTKETQGQHVGKTGGDGPCDNFRLDLTGVGFGACKCGHHRRDHR
jgi:hypothetical protein